MSRTQLLEIADRILKSWWTLVAGLCLGLSAGLIAMAYLPKVFEAETTIFVVPRQVPERLVPGTVTDDMSVRLGSLREALLSRPYMQQLILEVYGEIDDEAYFERLSRSVRARLDIALIRIDPRRGGGIFSVHFRDNDPARAAKAVNTLARLYIDQNVQFRTGQAKATSETMWRLVDEAQEQLRVKESEIAEFKKRHLYDTSEYRDANLHGLSASREELEDNSAAIARARDRLQTSLAQQEQAEWMTGAMTEGPVGPDPVRTELMRLRAELRDLQAQYHDSHPAVKKARKQLDDFLEQNSSLLGSETGGDGERSAADSAPTSLLQIQIESSRREMTRLESETERIKADIAEYRRRLENTPRVDQQLSELTSGYQVLLDNYRERLNSYEQAKAALRIEEAQQGERFEIVEEANPPVLPVKPDPMLVYGGSLIGGLLLFVGPLVLFSVMQPKIRSESGLRDLSESPVLVSIGRIPTPFVARQLRRRRIGNVLASAFSVVALVAVYLFFA